MVGYATASCPTSPDGHHQKSASGASHAPHTMHMGGPTVTPFLTTAATAPAAVYLNPQPGPPSAYPPEMFAAYPQGYVPAMHHSGFDPTQSGGGFIAASFLHHSQTPSEAQQQKMLVNRGPSDSVPAPSPIKANDN